MLHKETVNKDLIEIAKKLMSIPELQSFRLVGGTAASLHIGHRLSIDIDLFSNEKVNKHAIVDALNNSFSGIQVFIGVENIRTNIKGIRVELYDDWSTPFRTDPLISDSMRIATLEDIAAFKLEAITGRREKKDYIDLYFIFKKLGEEAVLNNFKDYNPHISMKSILFALGEVNEAHANKSVMPEMLLPISWDEIKQSMVSAAKTYLSIQSKIDRSKKNSFGAGL
jgi:hypothetical protein